MLKILALIFMTIDHIGHYLYPIMSYEIYSFLRLIGRLAFPLFALLVVKGMSRTKSLKKYTLRMLFFGILTQIIMGLTSTVTGVESFGNVLFTFFKGMLICYAVYILFYIEKNIFEGVVKFKDSDTFILQLNAKERKIVAIFLILISLIFQILYNTDYDYYGIFVMLVFFIFNLELPNLFNSKYKDINWLNLISLFGILLLFNLYYLRDYIQYVNFNNWKDLTIIMQIASVFSVFLIPLDMIKIKNIKNYKSIFYVYYPIHISILMILNSIL